jgi:hypothetical protein
MDKQTKTKIKNLALALRDDLEKEIENRLDNIGIYPDKEWKDGRSLTHLSKDEIEKRKRVAAFIKREEKIGLDQRKATSEFIKEASYTWINRLLGLKCMECRGLIEEVITIRPEYGGRSKRHRDFRDKNPDKAAQPDDALIACLFSAFQEVTEEIKVLFDPKNEYSLVIPRYPTLKKAIEKINTELDYNTYREDEFLGWVYQYFNSREKDRVFEEVRTKKKKISGSDIINVTQLYTEKYMVRFLVENSLGALWMEMHPDSQLCNKWEYFVKDPNNSRREPKQVKEITFLDPAGGSGHFQLYAFDLFYDMYLEEGIILKDQIPDFILRYNLHGIDIDLRAIQLSALGLYLKAKSKNPDMKVQHMNLVSADAIMLDSAILEEFLQEFKDDQTAQELIKIIWQGLENVRELGSLLKVEEQIDAVIERKRVKGAQKSLDERDWKEKGWEQWKSDLLAALKRYYEKAAQTFDINKQMFANEACKGVQLLDLLEQRYDVMATNPPYMHTRNMGKTLGDGLKLLYPSDSSDLYISFINRCIQLSDKNGFASLVSQQSFMFTLNYEDLRKRLLDNFSIHIMAHLGPHAFEDITGEKVNVTLFSITKQASSDKKSVFYRLVEDENKDQMLLHKIKNKDYYILNQNRFRSIESQPFVYWISNKIYSLFEDLPNLGAFFIVKNGISTGNNDVFLRFYWEVDERSLKWSNYVKGGDFNRYYGNTDLVVDYNEEKMRKYPNFRNRENTDYFSQEDITYTAITGYKFNARYKPKNFIFDNAGPCIFEKKNSKYDLFYALCLLNTTIIDYFLKLLNPTLGLQARDISRMPFPSSPDTERRVSALANQCVNIKKDALQFIINDRELKQTAIQWGYNRIKGNPLDA